MELYELDLLLFYYILGQKGRRFYETGGEKILLYLFVDLLSALCFSWRVVYRICIFAE